MYFIVIVDKHSSKFCKLKIFFFLKFRFLNTQRKPFYYMFLKYSRTAFLTSCIKIGVYVMSFKYLHNLKEKCSENVKKTVQYNVPTTKTECFRNVPNFFSCLTFHIFLLFIICINAFAFLILYFCIFYRSVLQTV